MAAGLDAGLRRNHGASVARYAVVVAGRISGNAAQSDAVARTIVRVGLRSDAADPTYGTASLIRPAPLRAISTAVGDQASLSRNRARGEQHDAPLDPDHGVHATARRTPRTCPKVIPPAAVNARMQPLPSFTNAHRRAAHPRAADVMQAFVR